jgi:hypothetical protein
MSTITRSTLGAGPDVVVKQKLDDGIHRIRLDEGNTPLSGRGNTARDAAKHLAMQLREQARLVEANEGITPSRAELEAALWRKAKALLQAIAEKHRTFAVRGMRYEAAPGTAAFIAEEHALIDQLLNLES